VRYLHRPGVRQKAVCVAQAGEHDGTPCWCVSGLTPIREAEAAKIGALQCGDMGACELS